MSNLLAVAVHDLRMHLAEKANVFFLLLMPLGFVLFFGLVMESGSGPNRAQVSLPVVDADGEFLAQAFVAQLGAESFEVDVYTPAEADTTEFRRRHIYIPEGFTRRVLAGEQVSVELRKKSGNASTADAAATIRLYQAQARFLGNLVRWNPVLLTGEQGIDAIDVAERGRFLSLIEESATVLVQSEYAGRGRPVPSGMGQSAPGIMVMFIVMTVLIGGSEALTREKQQGTLRRLATTPLARWQIIGGKVTGLTLLGLTQAAILILCTELLGRFGLFGIDFVWAGKIPAMLLILIPYCFCVASIGLLLGGLFRTTQQAGSLGWLVGLVMAGLGGTWWPLEVVPNFMRQLGHLFPTAWAMDGLHALITFGEGPAGALGPASVLLAMGLIVAWLGARAMRMAD